MISELSGTSEVAWEQTDKKRWAWSQDRFKDEKKQEEIRAQVFDARNLSEKEVIAVSILSVSTTKDKPTNDRMNRLT